MPEILFKVKTEENEFIIYADGSTKGFPDKRVEINYFPAVVLKLLGELQLNGKLVLNQ